MKKELSEFAHRLNEALDNFGIPPKNKGRQRMVAKMFEVSYESARQWLEGKSFPKTLKILQIASDLGVNPTWLISGKGNIHLLTVCRQLPHIDPTGWREIPLLNWEEIIHLQDNFYESSDANRNWVWSDCEIGPRAFALRMNDDSMEPRFPINCLIVIDPDYEPAHKNIVIVHLHEDNEVVCRQLLIDGRNKYLKPSNQALFVKLLEEDRMSIRGVVRQMRHQYI